MAKTLIIVESPHKASLIQGFLDKSYVVMASKGHIADLAKGGRFGLGVDINNDFRPKYILMDDKVQILDDLMNAAKTCDQILIASDPDREGEAIAWHLATRLEDMGKPIKRITFNQIKKPVVVKAIKNPRDIDLNLFHAQEARRILDRLVGFMASPFLMNCVGPKLSAGRVQSVVTRMIIDRECEIEDFVPEEFFTIQVTLSKNNKDSFITKYANRLTDSQTANDIKNKLSDKQSEYVVSEVISDEERKGPFAPLVTSTLQRIMSKEHNFSADRTMKAAQSLYESGYCSYIRTDSVRISDEVVEETRQWLKDNSYNVPSTPNKYKNKDASQDAHECIYPVEITLLPDNNMAIIDPDEKLVYKTIWNYFMASQMLPAVYNTLKVTAYLKDDTSVQVKASGKALKSKGFLELLGITDDSKIDIPNLEEGDILKLFGNKPVKLEKKQTQAPPRYSEDKLIKELDARGIGRPATYADLLSKISNRNYVEKKGNVFHATDLGKKVTNILTRYFKFMDYDFTKSMEAQLDEIDSGKINHIEMLKKFFPDFKKEIDQAYIDNGGTLCDKCGSPMVTKINKKDGSKFLGCEKFPNCRNIKSLDIV